MSQACADLLRGLLERNPQRRISFDRFFGHSFIDLDHMPSAQSLSIAVSFCTFLLNKHIFVYKVQNTEGEHSCGTLVWLKHLHCSCMTTNTNKGLSYCHDPFAKMIYQIIAQSRGPIQIVKKTYT